MFDDKRGNDGGCWKHFIFAEKCFIRGTLLEMEEFIYVLNIQILTVIVHILVKAAAISPPQCRIYYYFEGIR